MSAKWVHEDLVVETVRWFINRAVPDATPGWEDIAYEIVDAAPDSPQGKAWRVAYDIPVEHGSDVWLTFVIDRPSGRDPIVRDIRAIREDPESEGSQIVEWDDTGGMWVRSKT